MALDVTAELEVSTGAGTRQLSVDDFKAAATLAATEATLTALNAKVPASPAAEGTDGASPPGIPGTGIRGWLRSIYDRLNGTLVVSAASLPLPAGAAKDSTLTDGSQRIGGTVAVSGPLTDTQLRASAVPVTANAGTNLNTSALALDAHLTDRSQKAQITDGTRDGTVKAASTLPLGTDTAVVTTLRDGLPTGANTIGKADQGAGGASAWKVDGSAVTQPVSGPLTDTQLRATPVPVSGTVTATPTGTQDDNIKQVNGVTVNVGIGTAGTGTQRVAVSSDSFPATQAVSAASLPLPTGAAQEHTTAASPESVRLTDGAAFYKATTPADTQPVSGPLTDTQLRATPVPVSGTVTATGPLTDTQLRAVAVPVSGPVTDAQLRASAVPVTGPLTDTQLRAAAVPVSGTVNPTTPSAVVAFVTAVPTAGTRVQLASNAVIAGILQAPSTNAGLIYVGAVTVSGSVFGAELQPGQATGIAIDNTNRIYIDASSSGDKCAFLGS